jgi:hypothetical protein
MLSLLALTLQTAAVTTDSGKAAMRCATAAIVAGTEGESPLRLTSHFMYFAMQAAKAEQAGKPFLVRLGELAESAQGSPPPAVADGKAEIAACDRNFPAARSAAAAKLPADPFERDVLCLGTLSLLQGAAQQMKEDGEDQDSLGRISAVLAPINARLTDAVLGQHGITTEEAFVARMGDQLKASLALGNPATIARACGVSQI